MMHLAEYPTEKKYAAKVLKTKRLSPPEKDDLREILLEVRQPEFNCEVDQSFGVLVKTDSVFGNPYHHRLYSVADLPTKEAGKTQMKVLVKRCAYIDEFNGEKYDGIGSNYLCDRVEGDEITITGPFPLPFRMPEDVRSNMILIGMGTGIAPFRAFIKHIYAQQEEWKGKIRLFYGAKTGLDLLYMNKKDGDLTNYYDQKTFEAFHALSTQPNWSDNVPLGAKLEEQAEELYDLLMRANTYVYIAGFEAIKENLEKAFANILGSRQAWLLRKAELLAGNKWAELIF